MKKNDIIKAEIISQGYNGEGIARIEGIPVFIENALPGEQASIHILKVNKNLAFGKITSIDVPSRLRLEPPCPYYWKCGGCDLQHQTYESQLVFKRKRVKDAIERIGGVKDPIVRDTIGMVNPFRYRNKVQLPVGLENGKIVSGFYAKRSHRIIDMESCIIQHEDGDRVLKIVRNWMEDNGILPYQADGTGLIRHIMVRKGFTTGDLMVVIVATKNELPHNEDLTRRLSRIDGFKSLILNINDRDTNVILGESNRVLYGTDHIEDYISEFRFRISPHSFFQVNPAQTQVMYEKALGYAGLIGNETVFDAYCGAGTISMFLSKKAKKVYGVEIVREAVTDARLNAEMNGVTNIEFIEGKSEDVIADLIGQGVHADVVVVDPPRKGCERSLLESIAKMGPQRLVYVSCDAGTLGRDIGIMAGLGYGRVEATPVDNFPQTAHVETVVLMSRVKE
jgi:23S rRNA (uracil1939-C5)-methyltransferase